MIRFANVSYKYGDTDKKALHDVSLDIEDGEFIGIIGANGSGKSTLVKTINGLVRPKEGHVTVDSMPVDDANIWEIRRRVGMIFQNPDNQIVGTTVREDVAFGVENLGLPRDKIADRVDSAMEMAGITHLKDHEPSQLSGGQKQMVAMAGALAMQPAYLILDEATSMLDNDSRIETLNLIKSFNKDQKITIICITHFLEDLIMADRVAVMQDGRLAMLGLADEILSDAPGLRSCGLEPMAITRFIDNLREDGFAIPDRTLSMDKVVEALAGA